MRPVSSDHCETSAIVPVPMSQNCRESGLQQEATTNPIEGRCANEIITDRSVCNSYRTT